MTDPLTTEQDLPEWMRDPFAVLARGRHLLEDPTQFWRRPAVVCLNCGADLTNYPASVCAHQCRFDLRSNRIMNEGHVYWQPHYGEAPGYDAIDRIVERNRLLMEVVLKDEKTDEERREALERMLSADPFR